MLVLVAVMSLILGMGLPTTANYLVVSGLMAPVIIALGAKSGLILPLIAVHLFVFYFGILADDTPPVGLRGLCRGGDLQGRPDQDRCPGFRLRHPHRAAAVPVHLQHRTAVDRRHLDTRRSSSSVVAVVAMMLFASATQGWLLTRNRWWESAALLLVAFTLFRPGYWLDQIDPPFVEQPPARLFEIVSDITPGGNATVVVSGPNFNTGEEDSTTLLVPLGKPAEAAERLREAGLDVRMENGLAIIEEPMLGTPFFEKIANLFDFYDDERPVRVEEVLEKTERMPKELFYIPAFLLFGLIYWLQSRRRAAAA